MSWKIFHPEDMDKMMKVGQNIQYVEAGERNGVCMTVSASVIVLYIFS